MNDTKNNQPLVSVCVQTYQHASFIKECLDSILMQETNFPFEIILGEDESSDGTREICIEYSKNHPDIIRLFLRNREDVIYINGQPTGRFNLIENLKQAKGKYIALLEGDDYWIDPNKLQKQINVLEKNSNIICCHHWHKHAIQHNSSFKEIEAPTEGHGYLSLKLATVKEIFENKLRIKSRTIMFRNIICDKFFPDWYYKLAYGDVPLSFLLGMYGDFYFINEPMAVYRQTETGSSQSGKERLTNNQWSEILNKNWITIWDYGNRHFKDTYLNETVATVTEFYLRILNSHNSSLIILYELIKYSIFHQVGSLKYRYRIFVKLNQILVLKLYHRIKTKFLERQ